jgi:hypothetical protein
VVPSALRTMSVVTLLSAVSGTVFLLHDLQDPSAASAASAGRTAGAPGSGAAVSSVLAAGSIPGPRVETTDQAQARIEAEELRARAEKVAAKERAKAKAEAKAVAKAAAERRREQARGRAARTARRNPQALARILVTERGWGSGQFSCLKSLWTRESGWNYRAMNQSSGAYGIAQALPAGKMASAGSDWRTNPVTQMKWGLDYIEDRYGTPCGAWGHSESTGWY